MCRYYDRWRNDKRYVYMPTVWTDFSIFKHLQQSYPEILCARYNKYFVRLNFIKILTSALALFLTVIQAFQEDRGKELA